MARPIRVEFEGAVYHVTARGNDRKPIYRDDRDRERLLETLHETVERFGFVIYVVLPDAESLSPAGPNTARQSERRGRLAPDDLQHRFNRRHRRSGHLYQGRFKAQLVEEENLRGGLVLGGEGLWNKVRRLLADSDGNEEIRGHRRASAEETSRPIHSLVEQETDRRVAIWLRVRLGGERMTEVAEDYGYRRWERAFIESSSGWRKKHSTTAALRATSKSWPSKCQVSRVDPVSLTRIPPKHDRRIVAPGLHREMRQPAHGHTVTWGEREPLEFRQDSRSDPQSDPQSEWLSANLRLWSEESESRHAEHALRARATLATI